MFNKCSTKPIKIIQNSFRLIENKLNKALIIGLYQQLAKINNKSLFHS